MERLSDYDYSLPEERIAQEPLEDRSASRLLWLDRQTGEIQHRMFRDVIEILKPGDLLVMNNTRVTALRLHGKKETGADAEFLLLSEHSPYEFEVLAKPGKRLQPGARVLFPEGLAATITENLEGPRKLVRFDEIEGFRDRLREAGAVPLPPYVHKALADAERYQTVYSRAAGSAAAPTAGLHFTEPLLAALRTKGVRTAEVTLDVGIDTFRPVQVENLDDHTMHGETCAVSEQTARAVENCEGRIVAVGTTTVRTLESFAVGKRRLGTGRKVSALFIRPGYIFKIADGMFTNFHMPRTTMLMMISAFSRRDWVLQAYAEALQSEYRFLSFGDSMLIL